jgi:hypothetical protein
MANSVLRKNRGDTVEMTHEVLNSKQATKFLQWI